MNASEVSLRTRTPIIQAVGGGVIRKLSGILGIQQPLRGWKEVERAAPGYSKTNTEKTDQSLYYYRQKEKQKEEAKEDLQRT